MKKLFNKKTILLLLILVFAIILPNIPKSTYPLQILIVTVMYAFFTTSWNICGGYAGQLGLGNGLYIGIGAYLTGVFFNELQLSPWLGIPLAGFLAGIISLGIGSFTFKLRGTFYSLATVSVLNILRIVLNENKNILGWDFGGPAGLKVKWLGGSLVDMQFMDKRVYYYIILILLIISLFICWRIEKSKAGFYYKAIDTNQEAAASLGVNTMQYKMRAQFTSALLMGIGGGFYMMFYQFVDTVSMFSSELSFETMMFAVVGGRGTLFGPTIAACLLIPFNELLRRYLGTTLPGLPSLLYGVMLMLAIQLIPQGVVPLIVEKWKNRQTKKTKTTDVTVLEEHADE